MFLKSLELNGFKSFAQKTVLEFPAGITAIVGPNGSGKSNVIDSIRWLLGEREAKNLRGAKTEDLIWNGTPKRPRMSMAQAGLHFDNGSGFFPVDFKEVSVNRRIGRDGVSQYFLNKSEVRLKDIIDFMSRSRLGTKGLTIINQGSSDLFVRVGPEERRIMIEEILGLREYQIKKSEALRKLKNTFVNLEKVKAMIAEVAPRLRLLKRQTNKWSKRVSIAEELKKLEDDYFSFRLKEIESVGMELKPKLNSLEKEIAEKQKELNALESEIRKIESQPAEYEEIKKIKQEQNKLLAKRSEIQKELGRLEAKIEFLGSARPGDKTFKNEELLLLINEIKLALEENLDEADISKIKKVIKDLSQKISAFLSPAKERGAESDELAEFQRIRNGLAKNLNALEAGIADLEKREAKITDNLEEFNQQFQKNFELVESKREDLSKLKEQKNKCIFEKEKLGLKLQDLENQLLQLGRDLKEFRGVGGTQKYEPHELIEMERRLFKLRTELASIGEIDESLVKEAEEVENHYQFLTSQSKDLEKASIDLKELIKNLSLKIHSEFTASLKLINEEFNKFFRLMFGGGGAKLKIKKEELKIKNNDNENETSEENVKNGKSDANNTETEEKEELVGVEIELSLPKKRITSLEMLSGGEKSLVSIAALFALISVSPPPFLVLDEVDAALDESNSKRFANLIREFSKETQFIVVTHNRATMEAADILYGVTMAEDGCSKVLSLKLEA